MVANSESWSGRVGFILANIASAVGLGSIWKFPYEVGSNGGSAFVFCYLIGVAVVVLPLMLAELALGRHGRSDAIGSIRNVAVASDVSTRWRFVGTLGVVAGFLILSFYSVIGGWALAYLVATIGIGLPAGTAQDAQARFGTLLASPLKLSLYHLMFMMMTWAVIARGIAGDRGIAAVSRAGRDRRPRRAFSGRSAGVPAGHLRGVDGPARDHRLGGMHLAGAADSRRLADRRRSVDFRPGLFDA